MRPARPGAGHKPPGSRGACTSLYPLSGGQTGIWERPAGWRSERGTIVVTSAPIRRSEPQPTSPAITWPQTAAILDADGVHLTDVDVFGPPRFERLLFGDVV